MFLGWDLRGIHIILKVLCSKKPHKFEILVFLKDRFLVAMNIPQHPETLINMTL